MTEHLNVVCRCVSHIQTYEFALVFSRFFREERQSPHNLWVGNFPREGASKRAATMGYGDKYRTDMDITDEATGRARRDGCGLQGPKEC